jgi:hypothetical protein
MPNSHSSAIRLAGAAGIAFFILSGCVSQPLQKPPLAGVTIYAAGDIADCRWQLPQWTGAADTAALIASQLAADRSAMVLSLGDHTYPVGLPAEFSGCYAPTWGAFRERTLPAPGNHEYYTRGASGYYDYFGAAAAPERSGHYSVQLGKWRLISLNSALLGADYSAQLEWLKEELARHPSPCTLAFWHHPRYSSGGHGDNAAIAPIWKILADGGVDVALTAHDHDYERFAPQDGAGRRDDARGLRQFVVGTGGAQLTPLLFPAANSELRDNSTHGVLKLVLGDDGYEWEFLAVGGRLDSNGMHRFSDRGAASCH